MASHDNKANNWLSASDGNQHTLKNSKTSTFISDNESTQGVD